MADGGAERSVAMLTGQTKLMVDVPGTATTTKRAVMNAHSKWLTRSDGAR